MTDTSSNAGIDPCMAAYQLLATRGIGPRSVAGMLERYGSLEGFLNSDPEQWDGVCQRIAAALDTHRPEAQRAIDTWRASDHLYSIFDEAYPARLRRLPDPPLLLFVRGAPLCPTGEPAVVMVGSRQASGYGQSIARRLASDLVTAGASVGSGLAYGIDTASHTGALDGQGRTWACVAHGVDRVHPRRNAWLADRLLEQGGSLISEYRHGTDVQVHHFPARNRILAALADVVVVVEGARRSGALITADVALDLGVAVLAVPGRVGDPQAQAPLDLLCQGAAPAVDAASILASVGYAPTTVRLPQSEAPSTHQELFAAIPQGGSIHIDELARALGAPVTTLLTDLLQLELAGWVETLPGKYFSRSTPGSNEVWEPH